MSTLAIIIVRALETALGKGEEFNTKSVVGFMEGIIHILINACTDIYSVYVHMDI